MSAEADDAIEAMRSDDPDEGSSATAGAEPTGGVRAYAEVLRNKQYRLLFLSMLTSSLGDWIGVIAIVTLTEQIIGPEAAAFATAIVLATRILPSFVFGPVAGVFADRWDRKKTMIATHLVRAVVTGMLAFADSVVDLIAATFVLEMMSAMFIPAKEATLPNLIRKDQLVTANQLSLVATYGSFPLGGILVAALVDLARRFDGVALFVERPVTLAIWADASTFIVSAMFIAAMQLSPTQRRRRLTTSTDEGVLTELKDGFAFIATQPIVRAITVGILAATFAAGVVIAIGNVYATTVAPSSDGDAFGLLVAAVGLGMFAGLASPGVLGERFELERLFAPAVGIAGAALTASAFAPNLILALLPIFVMGFGAGLAFICGYTLIQAHTEDALRGRTFAAVNAGLRAAIFVALPYAPFMAGLVGGSGGFGVRVTLLSGGISALVGSYLAGSMLYSALQPGGSRLISRPQTAGSRRGVFISFEGGEGAGKSTQVQRLRDALDARGFEVLVTREPGGTPLGESIRSLLLDGDAMDPHAEAMLFAAARAQHAAEVIEPALDAGTVVLCDRYIDSSVVYQGIVRDLGEDDVENLNRWGIGDVLPDLTVLLDIDADAGLARQGTVTRMEQEGLAFHQAVNEAFRRRARAGERYVTIDANRDPDEVAVDVARAVNTVLSEAGLSDSPLAAANAREDAADVRDGSPASDHDGGTEPVDPVELASTVTPTDRPHS